MQGQGSRVGAVARAETRVRARAGAVRARARVVAALAVVLSLLLVPAAGARNTTRQIADEFYGVNAGLAFNGPDEQVSANLAAMRAAGLSVVRFDASWDAAEPTAPDASGTHTYRWESFDRRVVALAQHGLRWYPLIAYSASWATSVPGNMLAPPTNNADYTAFATAIAKRYGPGGDFWRDHPELSPLPVESYEIWNEPNFAQFWSPQESAPARYADLYVESRSAIHAVDPQAQVVVAGLTDWKAGSFVRAMYRHRPQLRGNVDAIGLHPYHYRMADVRASVAQFRRTLKGLGEGSVPIELTEAGWDGAVASEEHRADGMARLAREAPAWDLGVTRLLPYVWTSVDAGDDFWGIANQDGSLKPAGGAYANAIGDMLWPAGGKTRVAATPGRPIAALGIRVAQSRLRSRLIRPVKG